MTHNHLIVFGGRYGREGPVERWGAPQTKTCSCADAVADARRLHDVAREISERSGVTVSVVAFVTCEKSGTVRVEPVACTGLTAAWCPIHGDCSCLNREEAMDDAGCPLHSATSTHPQP